MTIGTHDIGQTRKSFWLSKSAGRDRTTLGGTFSFGIETTTPGESFTLPLGSNPSYIQKFTVDWGDSISSIITSYDDPDRVHAYTIAGTYDVVIDGICEYFVFDYFSDRELFKSLNDINNFIGLKRFSLDNCTNFNYINPSFVFCSSLTTLEGCFYRCTNLTSVPSGIFDNCISVTSCMRCFYYCSSLISIPSNLFDNCTSVTTFEQCFYRCTSLISIPNGLFDKNTLVTTFKRCFNRCSKLPSIPSGLFDNCILITSLHECFTNCTSLTAIPNGLFDNCTLITDLAGCFYGCETITTIPNGLFDNCTLITDLSRCFINCTSLTAIPNGLFDNCTLITDLSNCFDGCTGINTNLPTNLIIYNILNIYYNRMFSDCQNMTGTGLDFISTAEANATAQGITLIHDECFDNCMNLSDYALIPTDWK